MPEMRFQDKATLNGTRETTEGYLVADAFAVRTGIQLYTGAEVGKPEMGVVRVYRPEAEVRSVDSLRTFSHAPVTLGHPTEAVTKDNWRDLAVGEVSTEATWQDNKIKLPLILKDAAAIKVVRDQQARELSAGYTCELVFGDGVTPDGQPYDAMQRNIRINHLAIVDSGRAGSECRIGDNAANWGPAPQTKDEGLTVPDNTPVVAVNLGDRAIMAPQNVANDILQYQRDQASVVQALKDQHATELKAANDAKAKAEAERDEAKGQIVTGDALDKLVADRATLVATAKAIAPNVETKGLTDRAIRKAVVLAKRPEAKDKDDAYMAAAFDLMADAARKQGKSGGTGDPVAQALGDGQQQQQAPHNNGFGGLSLTPRQPSGNAVQDARARAMKARQGQAAHLQAGYMGDEAVKALLPQERME